MPTINFQALEERQAREAESHLGPDLNGFPRPEIKPNAHGYRADTLGSQYSPEEGWESHSKEDGTRRKGFERQGQFTEDNLDEIHLEVIAGNKELQEKIRAAMDGSLPLDRPLKDYEPQKLNPRGIQVVLLRIIGYQNSIIAALTGYEEERVSVLLNHPYAQHLMSVAFSASVASATNIHRRLQKRTNKMLDVVDSIASSPTTKPSVRLKAAFGWIDRAGYGATKKSDTTVRGTVSGEVRISGERATLLTKAIQEAKGLEIQDADYEIEDPEESGDSEDSEITADSGDPTTESDSGSKSEDDSQKLLPPGTSEASGEV